MSRRSVGVEALWDGARQGRSGVRELALPRTSNQLVKKAAHLPDFDAARHLPPEVLRTTDRFAHMALAAAREAVADAGWNLSEPLGDRTAVLVGSGIGGATTSDIEHFKFYQSQERMDPMTIPKVMPSAAASQLSMAFGARGMSLAISSACSSASQAIGLGLMLLRQGLADRALVGGSECLITPATFRAWETLRVMTLGECRPFSKGRDGMSLGEGAAMLFSRRKMPPGRVVRASMPNLPASAPRVTRATSCAPTRQGAAAAMVAALADAGLEPRDIGYVNAHGTGTILNDRSESREALRRVLRSKS